VLEEELGALEAFGELLANGLLDDAGAGEADEGAGFGDVEVAEHGEAGGDAASGGVSHEGDVGDLFVVHFGEANGDLGELHEAGDAFHHAGAAGGRDDDEWDAGFERAIDGAGDGFAYNGTHRAADEAVLHDGEDNVLAVHLADGVDDGVVEAGFLLGLREAKFVGLEVGKLERVGGGEVEIDELVAGVEEVFDAGAGVELEVAAAVHADLQVGFEIGLPERFAALATLDPKAFGADFVVGGGLNLVRFALEPGHGREKLLTERPRGLRLIVSKASWVLLGLCDLEVLPGRSGVLG